MLLIYSDNDPAVKKEVHFDALQNGLADKENIKLLLVSGKAHNPNYTENAVKLLGEYTATLMQKNKKKELQTDEQKKTFIDSFDWDKMTEQDERIWSEIIETLKS